MFEQEPKAKKSKIKWRKEFINEIETDKIIYKR